MTDAAELRALAAAVARVVPDWRDRERYYEQRSELAARLRLLARQVERREAAARRRYLAEAA